MVSSVSSVLMWLVSEFRIFPNTPIGDPAVVGTYYAALENSSDDESDLSISTSCMRSGAPQLSLSSTAKLTVLHSEEHNSVLL